MTDFDPNDITPEMVARMAWSLGAHGNVGRPEPGVRYEAICAYKAWHIMRVRGSGFEERRQTVRIVETQEAAEELMRQLRAGEERGR